MLLTVDPAALGYFEDPYAYYAPLRETSPVHQHPAGPWMLFRYDDVLRMLRDPALSAREDVARDTPRNHLRESVVGKETLYRSSLARSDPPDHTRLRRLLA